MKAPLDQDGLGQSLSQAGQLTVLSYCRMVSAPLPAARAFRYCMRATDSGEKRTHLKLHPSDSPDFARARVCTRRRHAYLKKNDICTRGMPPSAKEKIILPEVHDL